MSEKKVSIAVIGVGSMGLSHARDIIALPNTELVGVCDVDRSRTEKVAAEYGVEACETYEKLMDRLKPDAVLIATPHYAHVPISIAAMQRGIHVLVEKPIAVHAKDARKMIDAYEAAKTAHPGLLFAAMFMQRTYGYWLKIKDLIDSGELGQLVRTTWLITNWFRTQAYFDGGGWRATWRGEGGGVLLNQCPHNLDMYQWLVGMPQRVRGFVSLGKYHDIEVEDEVTAYFEHENGMVGHFITSTGESPGTNRLEIVGENGKLVYEDDVLTFFRNRRSMFTEIRESSQRFAHVENWKTEVPFQHHGQPGHALITQNFADAILKGAELIAPAAEGYNSVALGNAILFSSFENRVIDMPIDEDAFDAKLQALIASSRYKKPDVKQDDPVDMRDSFN